MPPGDTCPSEARTFRDERTGAMIRQVTDHCPYDDDDFKQGKWTVYAPQHTHPSFSPDGRYVVYTSNRTGHAQVYEVEVPEER